MGYNCLDFHVYVDKCIFLHGIVYIMETGTHGFAGFRVMVPLNILKSLNQFWDPAALESAGCWDAPFKMM